MGAAPIEWKESRKRKSMRCEEIDGLSSLAIAIFLFSIGCGRPVEKYEMFDFSLENEI